MPSITHYIDVEHVESVHHHPNVAYPRWPVRQAVWFTGDPRKDYLVSMEEMEKYEYHVIHDPVNTPLPRPLSFGIVTVLSPHANCLVLDTTITSDVHTHHSLGQGSGVFVNHEEGSKTQWHDTWESLLDIAGRILPLSVEPTSASGLFRVVQYNHPALRLTHSFFRPKPLAGSAPQDAMLDRSIVDPTFTIESWPVSHPAAKDMLRSMVDTHDVIPLPAFDRDGSVIAPSDYRRKLERAALWVEFSVEHTNVEGRGHAFDGVIKHIRVIEPPLEYEDHDARPYLPAQDDREVHLEEW